MKQLYFTKHNNTLVVIKIEDVFLIEADLDYIKINTSKNCYTSRSTMKDVFRKLPQNDFVRIHNSYIVRLDKIISISDYTVKINDRIFPISKDRMPELMNRITVM